MRIGDGGSEASIEPRRRERPVSRKVLEPTRSAERTDDPLWYLSIEY